MGRFLQSFLRDLIIALIQVILFSFCFAVSVIVYIGLFLHGLMCRVPSSRTNTSCVSNHPHLMVDMLSNSQNRRPYIMEKPVSRKPLITSSENHYAYNNFSNPQRHLQMPSSQIPNSKNIQPFSAPLLVQETDSLIASARLREPRTDTWTATDSWAVMKSLEFGVESSLCASQETEWQKHKIPAELEILQNKTPPEIANIIRATLVQASTLHSSRLDRETRPIFPATFSIFKISNSCHLTSNPWASDAHGPTRDRNDSTCSGTTLASESSYTSSKCSTGTSHSSVDTNPASVSWKEVLRVDPNKIVPGTMGFPSSAFVNPSPRSNVENVKGTRSSFFRKSCLRQKVPPMPEKKPPKECASCFDDIPDVKAVSLSCQHSYCGECFTRLVSTAVANEHLFPPKCCLVTIPDKTIIKNVDTTVMGAYRRAAKEYEVPDEDRWFCANMKCAKWFDGSKLDKRDHNLKCPSCKTRMCRLCRGLSHRNQEDCPPNRELEATLETVHLQGWVRCRQCHAAVEKVDGCLHITCRCSAQFW